MGNIAIGTNNITDLKLGNLQVSSVYLGTNLVWSSYTYILDLYGNAHHAYSLRKLRSAYGGFCLRVRRTTTTPTVTTTTVDVSFDTSNTISLNSLITYVSGTVTLATNLGQFCASVVNGYTNPDLVNTNQNIFVTTWFDQTGNSKNPTNATASQQPRLINLGNLETSGGKVAVRFTRASSQFLQIVDTTANISNMSSYWVGQFSGLANQQIGYLLSATTPNGRFYFPYHLSTNIYAAYGNSTTAIGLGTLTTDRKLYELLSPDPTNAAVVAGWVNGAKAVSTPLLGSGTSTAIQIGTGATNYFDGHIQEVIGYQSNAFRAEKETNINNYWTIY
jgi:hypothetical protein